MSNYRRDRFLSVRIRVQSSIEGNSTPASAVSRFVCRACCVFGVFAPAELRPEVAARYESPVLSDISTVRVPFDPAAIYPAPAKRLSPKRAANRFQKKEAGGKNVD